MADIFKVAFVVRTFFLYENMFCDRDLRVYGAHFEVVSLFLTLKNPPFRIFEKVFSRKVR
jgi:hypothetical protein